MNKYFLWLGLALLTVFCPMATASDWELRLDQDSIQVYTRKAANSDFKEFKGVTELKTSLNSLVALLEDTEACQSWMYKCIVERTLAVVSPDEKYNYSVSKGFPLSDRDSIVHIVRTQDADTKTITYQRTVVQEVPGKDKIPTQPNLVRVPMAEGSWILKPNHDGKVGVTFQMLSDPGGGVPPFLANSAVIETPYKTLLKLREEVMKPKYQNAHSLVDEM